MKFKLDSFNAYVINKVEGGYFLSNGKRIETLIKNLDTKDE